MVDFGGASKTFTVDAPYVGDDFDDKISSIRVSTITAGAAVAQNFAVVFVMNGETTNPGSADGSVSFVLDYE